MYAYYLICGHSRNMIYEYSHRILQVVRMYNTTVQYAHQYEYTVCKYTVYSIQICLLDVCAYNVRVQSEANCECPRDI